MKILYAVQATGNGHISRAMEILPYLERYGTIDIFLSGANSSLAMDGPVKYRSKGLCLYYNATGSLDYLTMAKNFAPLRIAKEVRDLPVEKYDLVLNDFESITAMACAYKKVPSVNFGHQASFKSNKVPRPAKRDVIGEWILNNYARATQYIGLHFRSYDDFILPPVIKKKILVADPVNKGHVTVYLPSYSDAFIATYLQQLPDHFFQVFSKEVKEPTRTGNIEFIPVGKHAFDKSLITCSAIIAGAGFETPAEAMYLGKKIMVVPIGGQYEQLCNAAALEQMGIRSIPKVDEKFVGIFNEWISTDKTVTLQPDHSTEAIISFMMHVCSKREKYALDLLYPELVF